MINLRIACEKDKENWNRVVESSYNGTIYHTWEWKDVVEKSFNAKNYLIVAEKDNEIIGIFPCYCCSIVDDNVGKKIPFISRYNILWSPYPRSWSYGGPCILPGIDDSVLIEMHDYMEKLIKKDKTIIDCRISPWDQAINKYYYSKKEWTVTPRRTAILDLSQNIDTIWMNLKKEHRNSIRKAQKNEISFVEAESESDISYFYNVLWKKLVERTGMLNNPYSYFKALWDLSCKNGMVKFYFAEYNNEKIAGIVVTCYKNLVLYEEGAYLREYASLNPTNLLLWHLIEDSNRRNYKILDLGGMPPDTDNGIYKFKNGWGGEIKSVDEFRKKFRYKRLRVLKKKFEAFRC